MRKILFSILIAGMSISFVACGSSKTNEKATDIETEMLFDLYGQFEEYTECTDIEGKTVDELIKLGYKFMGYSGIQGKYIFIFSYEDNNYNVILDDSATKIMENKEQGTTIGKVSLMIRDCVVEKCYLVPEESESDDTDTSKSADSYQQFTGDEIRIDSNIMW